MTRPIPTRKAQLRAALALAGKTADWFCVENDITPSHLYGVLRGKRESAKLLAAVDAFIAEHLPQMVAA